MLRGAVLRDAAPLPEHARRVLAVDRDLADHDDGAGRDLLLHVDRYPVHERGLAGGRRHDLGGVEVLLEGHAVDVRQLLLEAVASHDGDGLRGHRAGLSHAFLLDREPRRLPSALFCFQPKVPVYGCFDWLACHEQAEIGADDTSRFERRVGVFCGRTAEIGDLFCRQCSLVQLDIRRAVRVDGEYLNELITDAGIDVDVGQIVVLSKCMPDRVATCHTVDSADDHARQPRSVGRYGHVMRQNRYGIALTFDEALHSIDLRPADIREGVHELVGAVVG